MGKRVKIFGKSGIPYETYDTITEQAAWTPIPGKTLPLVWRRRPTGPTPWNPWRWIRTRRRPCSGPSAGDRAVVCPSFPENRRTVYQGYLFVGDRLLHETSMRNHPLTPMTDANLIRLMDAQSSRKSG